MVEKELINKGLNAKRESKYVDFKERFFPSNNQDWCEIIKDIVAMSNSGGGIILIGLDNSGNAIGFDTSEVAKIDPAIITDKVLKYTSYQFNEFSIVDLQKDSDSIVAFIIMPIDDPIVFTKPGTYSIGDGKQKTAFSQGTVYFRHGAKSEPANKDDLTKFIQRRIDQARNELLSRVAQVVAAPEKAEIKVITEEVIHSASEPAKPIRITDDPDAPEYRLIDPDKSHPLRQKDIIALVNERLPEGVNVNQHTIQTVRKIHKTDKQLEFTYLHKYGVPQYSPKFADWIVERYNDDNAFFSKAHKAWYKARYE